MSFGGFTYGVDRVIAEGFKHCKKVGPDVAPEALKDALAHTTGSVDDIWRCAKVCRMVNVILPYHERIG